MTQGPGTAADAAAPEADETRAWVEEFARTHGRPPRILHVGNIANNAYLNVKFLRDAGLDCHVMSYDYYDIMATPEWEGAERPEWFVQGPFSVCNRYLHSLIDGRRGARWIRWQQLRLARWLLAPIALATPRSGLNRGALNGYLWVRRRLAALNSRAQWAISWGWNWLMRVFLLRVRSLVRRSHMFVSPASATRVEAGASSWDQLRVRFAEEFAHVFPERQDKLVPEDAEQWLFRRDEWTRLFERYDVVQCYATDPIRALAADARPYVAFEHGTLRDFTLGDDPLHRMNALAYRLADHVFITNGDCLAYAQRLGITAFTPMIHPVDVAQHERAVSEPASHRRQAAADVVLFCPLRHDWAVKGTDIHIRALPAIIERHGPRVVLELCEWGAELDRSRELIDALGCRDNVVWLPPLNRPSLIAHMKTADVVLDQMALPHFGATAPQALAAGRPVVMSYEPESTAWIVDEPAPILAAFDPAGVAAAVDQALDPDWRRKFEPRARRWTHTYHHPRRIVSEHVRIYRDILGGT